MLGSAVRECFNSLQTGKSFRTTSVKHTTTGSSIKVSIPFKRESPFGPENIQSLKSLLSTKFQFPSNGKVLSDEILSTETSIKTDTSCFNSLQTGKSFRTRKCAICSTKQLLFVSIPFKRESPFGLKQDAVDTLKSLGMFQFPSNGKVLADEQWNSIDHYDDHVSIPFKRESPFGHSLRWVIFFASHIRLLYSPCFPIQTQVKTCPS